jgi:predicted extracellular nuclease
MKNLHLLSISFIIILASFSSSCNSQQQKNLKTISIGFYNLENLFDTILNPELFLADQFTPKGKYNWTSERYQEKLENMASVISQIALDDTPEGLSILGVCEVENKGVLDDLVNEKTIKDRNYQIVHFDSPDRRGIDVALLYNPTYFEVTNSKAYPLTLADDTSFKTRSQLVVSGLLDGEEISIIVNHWPSRRGGEEKSRYKRNAAGDLSRHIVDSLLALDKNAKILVMGDLNDDPDNESVLVHLKTKGNRSKLKKGELFNPAFKIHNDSTGTLTYRGKWNLFDQIILSQGLLKKENTSYQFKQYKIFDKPFLRQQEGKYKGYPHRTFGGGVYIHGFSDHLPVYVLLVKDVKGK